MHVCHKITVSFLIWGEEQQGAFNDSPEASCSRDTGRWIIPKGWPSKRLKDCKAAAREARQEAGVKGKILREAIGSYWYVKRELGGEDPIEVRVFLLKVSKRCKRWPERRERRRAWFEIEDAANKVSDPELSVLISMLLERYGEGGRSSQDTNGQRQG